MARDQQAQFLLRDELSELHLRRSIPSSLPPSINPTLPPSFPRYIFPSLPPSIATPCLPTFLPPSISPPLSFPSNSYKSRVSLYFKTILLVRNCIALSIIYVTYCFVVGISVRTSMLRSKPSIGMLTKLLYGRLFLDSRSKMISILFRVSVLS